ncbi:hypothetical protein ACLIIZ_17980 [Azonexus caeni]|jgi:hypothetical protein|uniref:hypothetical protein n=1 Tax=Azonexus caeni TaxID=266126 RepID=UPI003A87EBFF
MAAENGTTEAESAELRESQGMISLSLARRDVIAEASFEIDTLARVVAGVVPLKDDNAFYAVRGIAARLLDLASIVMSGMTDETESTSCLGRRLRVE